MAKLLPEICKIQYGYPFDSERFSTANGVPLVRIRDVLRGYSETYTNEDCSDDYIVNNGDILIGMDGEFNIAKWRGGKAVLNQRVCRLIPTGVDSGYLYHFMPSALKAIEDKTPFVTVKHLSAKELNKIEVPLPPIDEQRRIAAVLDKAAALIDLRKQQLAELDELVKARFVEMFGDPVSNPKGWKMVELGELTSVGSSKRIFEKEYVPEGVPFYRTKEIVELSKGNSISTELFITKERFEEIKEQYAAPKAGDLLISAVGTIGVIWIVDGKNDFYFKDGNLIRVDASDKFNSIYMKNLLENLIAEYKKQISSGTAYAALTISGVTKMKVYDVPMEHQNQFSDFVKQLDKSKAVVQKSLDEARLLFDSLMQKYFG